MTEFIDLLNYIGDSATDAECKELFNAANARLKALRDRTGAANAAKLAVNDIVTLTGLKPKYLNGCVGVVAGIEHAPRGGTVVSVKLDADEFVNSRAISSRGPMFRVPASCVQVVE